MISQLFRKSISLSAKASPLMKTSCRLFQSSSSIEDPIADELIKSYVLNHLKDHTITLFTKQSDHYSRAAKDLLESSKIPFNEVRVDTANEKRTMEALFHYTGQEELPNIFLGRKHIGMFNDLRNLDESGELDRIVKDFSIKEKKL